MLEKIFQVRRIFLNVVNLLMHSLMASDVNFVQRVGNIPIVAGGIEKFE